MAVCICGHSRLTLALPNPHPAPTPTPLPQFVMPQFGRSHPLDLHLFLSESRSWQAAAAAGPALWVAADVPLAEAGVKRQFSYAYHPSKASAGQGPASGAAAAATASGAARRGAWVGGARPAATCWSAVCPTTACAHSAPATCAALLVCSAPPHRPAPPGLCHSVSRCAGGAEQRQRVCARSLHANGRLAQPSR